MCVCTEFPADPAWKFPAPGVKPLCCFPSFGASLCFPPPAPLETAVSEAKGARARARWGWRGAGRMAVAGGGARGFSPPLSLGQRRPIFVCQSLGSWCGDAGKGDPHRDAGDVTREEWRPAGPHRHGACFRSGRWDVGRGARRFSFSSNSSVGRR